MRRNRHRLIGKGKKCPKCSDFMERRGHLENDERVKQKVYYFTEWDYCKACVHVQHYDHFKVSNEK